MKRKLVKTIVAVCTAALLCGMMVFAAPQQMPDGGTFDPQFYASTYPDVVAVFGTDANALYQHYQAYGKKEGRLPYDPATVTVNSGQPTITSTKQYSPGMVMWAATPLIKTVAAYGINGRVITVQTRSDGIAIVTQSDDANFLDVCTPTVAPYQTATDPGGQFYVNSVASMGQNSRIWWVTDNMLGLYQYGTMNTLLSTEVYLLKQ